MPIIAGWSEKDSSVIKGPRLGESGRFWCSSHLKPVVYWPSAAGPAGCCPPTGTGGALVRVVYWWAVSTGRAYREWLCTGRVPI